MPVKENILTISTPKTSEGATTAHGMEFFVGGVEIGGVFECTIEPLSVDSVVMATIKVAVRLGS